MKKNIQRDYAIRKIEELKKARGSSLFDFNRILAVPTRDLEPYLNDYVSRPLEHRLGNASREGFGSISYVIYSGFNKDKELIHQQIAEGFRLNMGNIPEGIEIGLNLTKERHITKPKAVELMIYVKALQDEEFLLPDDIMSRSLAFSS